MATQAIERSDISLKDKGTLVETLWQTVDEGAGTLEAVPALVRKVLLTGAWSKRLHKGRVFEHDHFLDFITSKPLAGCGWSPEKVVALIKDDAEVLELWRGAITREAHRPAGSNNNVMTSVQGNSKAYTLDRLKREAPKLFDAVCAGELSANAAAIEAGFRKKPAPFEQVKKLIRKLTPEERRELIKLLEAP